MRAYEFITEAEASDADLQRRWGDQAHLDRPFLPRSRTNLQPAATLWTAYEVVQDILGKQNVTDDDDELVQGMYYVFQHGTYGEPMFRGTSDTEGSIELPDLDSTAAKDIAVAAHEAYHAYIHRKASGGAVFANEKIVNKLAEKWLRKNLSGTQLYAAIEALNSSRIHYGQHHMPSGPRK